MATIQTFLLGERWLDEMLIAGSRTDVGADADDDYLLPAGVGDVAILQIMVLTVSEATPVAETNLGILARVKSGAGGSTVDIVGSGKWMRVAAARAVASIDPDALCLWRQTEAVNLWYPELDSNGAPTDDHTVYFKVVRVRPIEAPASNQIQLVR